MIKKYNNGNSFLDDNLELLNKNKYASAFFVLDAKMIDSMDKDNYAFKVEQSGKVLLVLKKDPYSLLLLGDKDCLDEALIYLTSNHLEFDDILCASEIGDYLISNSKMICAKEYYQRIGMDFMEARDVFFASSNRVSIPTLDDIKQIYQYVVDFYIECGLEVVEEAIENSIMKRLDKYRVIKENGKIVSGALINKMNDEAFKISEVYTLPAYRCRGYAKEVVNYCKNEILNNGFFAVLNVDKANPISNHVYASLGFKKLFSQGVYKVKND